MPSLFLPLFFCPSVIINPLSNLSSFAVPFNVAMPLHMCPLCDRVQAVITNTSDEWGLLAAFGTDNLFLLSSFQSILWTTKHRVLHVDLMIPTSTEMQL